MSPGEYPKTMALLRIGAGRYEAQCQHCGAWHEIEPRRQEEDAFFVHWQADFTCCGVQQRATLTVEKDELDFH